MPARPVLLGVILLASACGGGGTAVSQTSSGVALPAAAPPSSARGTAASANRTPVPPPKDARERVVFVKAGAIWMMKPDGSEAQQITVRAGTAADEDPALSPRGDAVAYASARDGVSKIYVVSLAGADAHAVTDGADGGDGDPGWSPDGKRIAFLRGDPRDQRDLYVIDLAGGGPPRLLLEGTDDEPALVGGPVFSPDGATIAFAADRRNAQGTGVWLIGADGLGLRRLTPPIAGNGHLYEGQPSWSPDGAAIAFTSNRHVPSADYAEDNDVYRVAADGTSLTRLTSDPGVAGEPAFAPDGARIYFASTRDRRNPYEVELYVMPAGGGEQRRLTRDERPQNRSPSAGLVSE